MKHAAVLALLSLISTHAFAAKSCDALKDEISKKLDAKGVKGYALEVVNAQEGGDKKVVGTCEAGSKKILYAKK